MIRNGVIKLPEILQTFLDNIGLGTALAVLIASCTLFAGIYSSYKKLLDERKAIDREQLLREQEEASLKTTVENAMSQINDLSVHLESISRNLEDLTAMVRTHDTTLDNMGNNIDTITSKIKILVESDIESFESYIMDEYDRFVRRDKCIDMLSLQKIENIYSLYKKEIGDNEDETIKKLIAGIRELRIK